MCIAIVYNFHMQYNIYYIACSTEDSPSKFMRIRAHFTHHQSNSNPIDRDNVSHLHIACAVENDELVKKLIDAGANVNEAVSASLQCNWNSQNSISLVHPGSTPLHIAMRTFDNEKVKKVLIEANVDVYAKDSTGRTPLHYLYCTPGTKELLLSALVTRDCVVNGISFFHRAASCVESEEDSAMYGWMVEKAQPRIIIETIIEEDHPFQAVADKLINIGADVNSADLEGNTPLHIAVRQIRGFEHTNQARILMSLGADVFAKNSWGESPISEVLKCSCLLGMFMAKMKDDEEKRVFDKFGMTKLHMACKVWKSHEETIIECLKNGANVNAQIHHDSKVWPGYTPLHMLIAHYPYSRCYRSHYNHLFCKKYRQRYCNMSRLENSKFCKILRLLLKYGTDVMIADVNGDTPLHLNIIIEGWGVYMDTRYTPRYINILMNTLMKTTVNPVNAKGVSLFHLACIKSNFGLMKRFLKIGVNVNQTVDYFSDCFAGYTPLHFAVVDRTYDVRNEISPLRSVQLLLSYGANIHAINRNGQTPLHLVAQLPCVFGLAYKRIVWAGGNPESRDIHNSAPVDDVKNRSKEAKSRCIRFLCLCISGYIIDLCYSEF